ncbi:UvrD-helicase domain-containing protein [Lysobacter sp. GX 14042]|uniref:UvrD-helicase domain-containing protein n=1 Tax=Lysobacter sp. GX 14042 TaxID=2907155 RepID=UPI001F23EA75|nr:exodeoxyribonuclease V subunit beta [Lysobacter sp. GX 14042]MCE7032310.1 UvrD-helicase domain-containing protein [Lysobacter sp. GX 14042]
MNAPVADIDPYLALPLEGVQLVEASAGTGKTFTLATLVTRMVVEQGLRIGQVLAVTYTEAATQELRERIRARLDLAASVLEREPGADEGAEAALCRDIVARHLAGSGEDRDRLRRRLRQAAWEADLAAIFTIHGFCARVLREHALESGHGLDTPTVLTSDAALREELAADLWRHFAADPQWIDPLARLWSAPPQLAADLRVLLSREPLLPAPPTTEVADPGPGLEAAARALCAAFAEHGDSFRAELAQAIDQRVLNGSVYKTAWLDKCWAALDQWSVAGDFHAALAAETRRLCSATLREKTNKAAAGRTPESPLCGAMDRYVAARDARDAWLQGRAATLLHRVRELGRGRLATLKRVRRLQTYDDMIDGVADALAGEGAPALVAALRAQYRVALVDEFQDTDPRQWSIFRQVFAAPHGDQPAALFLIGDPKQAIYGFRGGDVETYLAARQAASVAPALDRNFRSRPAVLGTIAALYAGAAAVAAGDARLPPPFVDERIDFHPVLPGGRRRDADFLRGGNPAPALVVREIHDPGTEGTIRAGRARALATRACVAAIHQLLADARGGQAVLEGRAVQPGDIAVLVRKHHEATEVQQALAAAGIPAVAAGRRSLFATAEARELLALFEALVHPADDARLRTALATVLVGLDATQIDALETDGQVHAGLQRQAQDWRERWQRSGAFALVSDLAAAAGERLLGVLDGERRLTNYLQLGERMQSAQVQAPGLHAQLDWLRAAIANADPNDESQLLRLESDAGRVQIVTLHKSKGLEYPLVFLPFAGIGARPGGGGRHCAVHGAAGRELHWKLDSDEPRWKDAEAARRRAAQAEDARLLYVGLTRARHGLWVAAGRFYNAAATPLAAMVRGLGARPPDPMVVVDDSPVPPAPAPLPPLAAEAVPAVRRVDRVIGRDWWVYSFSQLARADAGTAAERDAGATGAEQGAADEVDAGPPVADEAFDPRFAGSRFGNVLHDALEHVDFAAWSGWRDGAPPPAGEDAALRDALIRGGYPETDLDAGAALLAALVGHTLVAPLPEGGRLCAVPAQSRRVEMEFHFALAPTRVDALLALLHRHGVLRGRGAFGSRSVLEGLMTGKIDLTYTAGGRWFVLDYKSNRLPAYDASSLQAAMAASEYDLQALLYTLAVHRWLRFRLGAGYDYARDFGGIRYVFSRGLAQGRGEGIHAQVPAAELVHALDALLSGEAA